MRTGIARKLIERSENAESRTKILGQILRREIALLVWKRVDRLCMYAVVEIRD